MSSAVLVALRIKASPGRVFDAFTKDIGLWWRPNALFAFTPRSPGVLGFEPGPGGRLTETLPNGQVFEIGRITEWTPPSSLAFTWRQATFGPEQSTEVRVTFEPVGAETRVSVEHRGWDSVPAAHVAKHGFPETLFLTRHGEWWRSLLASLGAHVR